MSYGELVLEHQGISLLSPLRITNCLRFERQPKTEPNATNIANMITIRANSSFVIIGGTGGAAGNEFVALIMNPNAHPSRYPCSCKKREIELSEVFLLHMDHLAGWLGGQPARLNICLHSRQF